MPHVEGLSPVCANSGCDIAKSGKCLEGLASSDCPHYNVDAPVTVPTDVDDVAAPGVEQHADVGADSSNRVDIQGDLALDGEQASAILAHRPAIVVGFAGPIKAGKTSLIACVYDLFHHRQYKNLEFAGSSTLMAFEKISFVARINDGIDELDQPRTSIRDQLLYYHLDVVGLGSTEPTSLLLADRSGEFYREICNKPSLAIGYPELSRGVVLNILVDGAKLCDPGGRLLTISEARSIVQALAERSEVFSQLHLNLVLTKLDLVEASAFRDQAHEDFDTLLEEISRKYGAAFGSVSGFRTAALPTDEDVLRGEGIEGLVSSWSTEKRPVESVQRVLARASRAMDCFYSEGK